MTDTRRLREAPLRETLANWKREAAACRRLARNCEAGSVEAGQWQWRAEAIEELSGDIRAALDRLDSHEKADGPPR